MRVYYARRAPEYDDWYDRKNQYDKGEALNEQWFSDVAEVTRLVAQVEGEHILEIAAGTGRWTQVLAERNMILPSDASSDMLKRNWSRTRLKGAYLDAFMPIPEIYRHEFTMCFFGFWLSHIPRQRVADFMALVKAALPEQSGRVMIVDSYYNRTELNCLSHKDDVQLRALKSGETFRVAKHYYTRSELETFAEYHFSNWSLRFTDHYFFLLDGTLR